ncbi:hypothetical protein QVD17_07055 [Tagetes erecta]|uniref:Homeobox domain-containing protein n=1 Tax=Tagetes erecta TaxID=13708 RepID=A0AAD8PBT2_TARER|nr:hypothetical protein QVD17_07055 [Tagetes erecta]
MNDSSRTSKGKYQIHSIIIIISVRSILQLPAIVYHPSSCLEFSIDEEEDIARSDFRSSLCVHHKLNLEKDNPHPEEKERLALGKKLNLKNKQVKLWFQNNRRTQMKVID